MIIIAIIVICSLPNISTAKTVPRKIEALIVRAPLNISCSNPTCTGPLAGIYCHGEILEVSAQFGMDQICPGQQLVYNAETVIDNFKQLTFPIKREDFVKFCNANFRNASYLEYAEPEDWKDEPPFFVHIKDERHNKLAHAINARWKILSRKFGEDVFRHPNLYPILPVQKPFIVPGGQFQTYFYWDTFWVNKGLLVSGMFSTVRGILDNFADITNELGYIPNGGYLYLQRRTQPPFFVHMVYDYYLVTKNLDAVKEWMPAMDKEMEFFINNRTILTGTYAGLHLYNANSNCPRPENFLSDVKLGLMSQNSEFTWKGMATACESGWDFSSRWFAHDGPYAYQKRSIRTHEIIPVDLNTFMAENFAYLSELKSLVGDKKSSEYYSQKARELEKNIDKFLWNEKDGVWYDLDIEKEEHRRAFYPSNVYPLLLANNNVIKAKKVREYILKTNVLYYPGGIPSTDPVNSTEQWDFPNVWAPSEHQFIKSLWSSKDPQLIKLGTKQAQLFVNEVFNGLFEAPEGKGGLWEKYDARTKTGHPGEGGEYPVQEGFGWTNGAVLDLIATLAMQKDASLHLNDIPIASALVDEHSYFGGYPHFAIILCAIFLLTALCLCFILCGLRRKKSACDPQRSQGSAQPLLSDCDDE